MNAVRRSLLLCALAVASGCGGPPGSLHHDDAAAPFSWQVAVSDLEHAILAACGAEGAIYAVGGSRGTALVLEWSGDAWLAPALPGDAGVLWWCWVDERGAAWAVGEQGTVLRRHEGEWRREELHGAVSGTVSLFGIWGSAFDDIHVVGGSLSDPAVPMAIAHHDGTQWLPVDTGELPPHALFKVWGVAADDVWAVGAGGTALHYDGVRWRVTDTPTDASLIAVWGTGSQDVYAVGGTGTGVILHHDGAAWATLATTPEELAGVWTAPDRPLYVGGHRGYLARLGRDASGRVSADELDVTTPMSDICVHALHGTSEVIVAASADLLGGGASGWRGTILTHGARLDGPVLHAPGPDGGVDGPDAGVGGPDAGVTDASSSDARQGPGPGELCGPWPDFCRGDLECWLLLPSTEYICTQTCTDVSECVEYGPDACCKRPGFQVTDTVCIPGHYPECDE